MYPYEAGMPDRVIFASMGWHIIVELKTTKGALSEIQKYQIGVLQKLGHRVEVIRSVDDLNRLL